MTGPKLNEKSYAAGERSGTKAQAKYVRTSASKVRAVLDLIRGLDVKSADQVLQLTDRHTAIPVRKVLASAVANAVNNDSQDADELYIVACYADEGPTLRRFKPRARGRATRINKRTCHITVIVARMSDDRIAILTARAERAGSAGGRPTTAASRRDRVSRSRRKAEGDDAVETTDEALVDDAEDTADDAAAGDEARARDESAVEADQAEAAAGSAEDSTIVAGEWPGSAQPLEDVSEMPEGFEIKGNAGSMLYHEPGTRYYKATKAEVWFDSVESAEAAGFSKPGAKTEETEQAAPADAEDNESAAAAEGSASDEAGVDSDPDGDEQTS